MANRQKHRQALEGVARRRSTEGSCGADRFPAIGHSVEDTPTLRCDSRLAQRYQQYSLRGFGDDTVLSACQPLIHRSTGNLVRIAPGFQDDGLDC